MTGGERLSDAPASEHGTEPMLPSGGAGPTHSVMGVLMQQARTLEAMADTLGQVVAQNHELMSRLLAEPEDDGEQDDSHGYDMAGNRVKVS